jgi:hypothetical protein
MRMGSTGRGVSGRAGSRGGDPAAARGGGCGAFGGALGRRSSRRSPSLGAGFGAGRAATAGDAGAERAGWPRWAVAGWEELIGAIGGCGAGRLATALWIVGAEGGLGSVRVGASGRSGALVTAGRGAGADRDDSAASGPSRRVSAAAGLAAD